jgi:hypothetical protein
MSALESWLLGYLLNALWQVPLVFAAGWVAARLARHIGPSMEHRIWVGTLLLQVVLPFCRVRAGSLWMLAETLVSWSKPGGAGGGVRILTGPGTTAGTAVLRLPHALVAAVAAGYVCCLLYFVGRLGWGLWRTATLRRQAECVVLNSDALGLLERSANVLGVVFGSGAHRPSPVRLLWAFAVERCCCRRISSRTVLPTICMRRWRTNWRILRGGISRRI